MSKLDELIQQANSFSRQEMATAAKNAAEELIAILDKHGMTTDNLTDFLINIFKLFISGDKKTRDGEYYLFKDLFDLADLTTDAFFELTNYGADPEFVTKMDEFIDIIPSDAAVAVVTIGILIITSDHDVTSEEIALLNRIIKR